MTPPPPPARPGVLRRLAQRWLTRAETHAQRLARADLERHDQLEGRHFSLGTKPVIRWIKGNGLDDAVTRAAIAQASRLFGSAVDYCLCTHDISPGRARDIMAWSGQPVEWWPIGPGDNAPLAALLAAAGCPPEHFGYWWKWFPERVRPEAPEWILDGDMVITRKPEWFAQWAVGKDRLRVAQDDKSKPSIYGRYADMVDMTLSLYSGLVSLPPGLRYSDRMCAILSGEPLAAGHDGRKDMSEQGVVAACFQALDPLPIPLCEFPFARAFQAELDFGARGNIGTAWGFHFGNSFVRHNPHFDRLQADKTIFSGFSPTVVQRSNWLGGSNQWGIPGWSSGADIAALLLTYALAQPHREVLEIGTSRGHMTAILAESGFRCVTIDRVDRGARQNLAGLDVDVVCAEACSFLAQEPQTHGLIIVDIHGNSPRDWAHYRMPLMQRLKPGGTLLINNAELGRIEQWREETGVSWFLSKLPRGWTFHIDNTVRPGIAIVNRPEEK